MPRKPIPETQRRTKQIIAKVTPAEHRKVVRAAKAEGRSISEYLRFSALGLR